MRPCTLVIVATTALWACAEPPTFRHATLTRAQRPDTPGGSELYRYDPGDVVEHLDSAGGRFRVHFTRTGRHAVPLADADTDGVPDHVQAVAATYDQVDTYYASTLGLRQPLTDLSVTGGNGGDGRFDVYLLDFALAADGMFARESCLPAMPDQCTGYMVQENDFAGYGYPSLEAAIRTLASHEYFHAVQAAYDADQGSILAEGTAVWATERFDPFLDDFEHMVDGYLSNADRSLDVPLPGPVDRFSYGTALFFRFLDERHGPSIIRDILESTVDGAGGQADPGWFSQLPGVLAGHGTTFPDEFLRFATWNLFTGRWADRTQAYQDADRYPTVGVETVSLPHQEVSRRVFYASAHYLGASPGGRTEVTAALVPSPTQPDALTGLRLVLGVRRSSTQETPVVVDPATQEPPVLAAGGATQVVVVVVNTAPSGSSRKPGLCVGSPEEVARCKADLLGSLAPNAGVLAPDAGPPPPPDGGAPGSGGDPGGEDGDSRPFHCSSTPGGTSLLGLLAVVTLGRRWRSR